MDAVDVAAAEAAAAEAFVPSRLKSDGAYAADEREPGPRRLIGVLSERELLLGGTLALTAGG